MLHLKKVLGAKPKEHVVAELAALLTPWGEALDAGHVLEEHPDPQFARAGFLVLNGRWTCSFVDSGHDPAGDLEAVVRTAPLPAAEAFDCDIVVPFSPEAPLSGVGRQLQPDELLWYRRMFEAPSLAGGSRLLLHFQAVDYACAVRVNGRLAGTHVGGYLPFTFDVTGLLVAGANELAVCVADPSEFGGRLRGKQRFDRGDIWYTAQSGIWQSVWMETVPAAFIESVKIEPDAKTGVLAIGARLGGLPDAADATRAFDATSATGSAGLAGYEDGADDADGKRNVPLPSAGMQGALPPFKVDVLDEDGAVLASAECGVDSSTCAVALHVPDVRLWSPADPHLYKLRFSFGDDVVHSYCAFRTVEMGRDQKGHARVFLNGEPLFIKGVLDQAYWSDGLMTAPADDALVYDIEAMKADGFNLMRKHIKVEAARWYYHCDRLGMLVLQDMVSGGDPEIKTWHWSYKPTLFKFTWNHMRDDTPSNREKLGAGDAGYREEWTRTCRETIELLGNHPCIIGWSLMNEGWGQFDARTACNMVRTLDPTRVIDAVSGWYDQRCGDFHSVHNYFRDMAVWRDRRAKRAFFVSEFGGFTHRVDGHSSLDEAYGYEPYDDIGAWRSAVRTLLAEMDALEPKGLAGYVYTQVSDIEEETNGILTYDRRVNKLQG